VAAVAAPELDEPSVGAAMGAAARRRAAEAQRKEGAATERLARRPSRRARAPKWGRKRGGRGRGKVHDLD
jgi:hypothetical protein